MCANGNSAQLPISIADNQLSASSSVRPESGPQKSHLDSDSGWVPSSNDKNQWLMGTFSQPQIIYAVSTQGLRGEQKWVSSYYLMYSMDGTNFTYYQEEGQRKVQWNY